MSDLTDFLLARIAEDEAVARAAIGTGASWRTMTEETADGENIYYAVEVRGVRDSTLAEMSSDRQIGSDQAGGTPAGDVLPCPRRVRREASAGVAPRPGRDALDGLPSGRRSGGILPRRSARGSMPHVAAARVALRGSPGLPGGGLVIRP